jgi:hypothetical protein
MGFMGKTLACVEWELLRRPDAWGVPAVGRCGLDYQDARVTVKKIPMVR